ncbi:PadR family transcriptional regulator [Streptomonospora litoralis]|uniref:Transcriptional regulator PadR-like family protein n=1 Tax=Streptomonospora litoralis TaxID=2498135 RepID=A0A4P6Q8B6_9ACTN|nr:PadR family transcriptional regulator [Streptomonospora litoralis]QBI55167.1 Transcriptional regulator PadR-like family protein [Streptomonospora litoralis]
MSATRLLVLGVVRASQRAHGYQVRRELLLWETEQWANIKPGSVYHALRQLLKNGMLRSAGVEESGEGPERTLFELTEAGEDEFIRLLSKALSDASVKPEFFGAGITFLTCQPRGRAISLLRFRLSRLEGEQQSLRSMLEHGSGGGKPEHVWELFRSWQVLADATIAFTRELVERLESGAYTMSDEGAAFGSPEWREAPSG